MSDVALLQALEKENQVGGLDPSCFLNEGEKIFELCQILAGGIRGAFGDTTNSLELWYRLKNMPLREVRGVWQTIANVVAADCLDPDGNIDVERLEAWMALFGNAKIFRKIPFCFIPHVEFVRSQIYRECECLLNNQNGARDKINATSHIDVSLYGQSILDVMFPGMVSPFKPSIAILASLFTPHRQWSLPTCEINSTINAEIRNRLKRPIEMYMQMLGGDQFTFPSGYAVKLQPIADGFITADLQDGGMGKREVFKDIASGDSIKIDQQKKRWREEGIEYTESADGAEKYKLRLPVHNMNDLLFAHFFLASNFGNFGIYYNGDYGSMLVYAGHENESTMHSSTISVGRSNFLGVIAALKEQAEAQRQLGYRYMRVRTKSSIEAHGENIDIEALLALDPNNMESGKAYAIGDRNWSNWDASQDIPRLAIRKVVGAPSAYEFGTLWGAKFEKADIIGLHIYTTGIEKHDAEYWEQFCN
jgi:hypothetical protein